MDGPWQNILQKRAEKPVVVRSERINDSGNVEVARVLKNPRHCHDVWLDCQRLTTHCEGGSAISAHRDRQCG